MKSFFRDLPIAWLSLSHGRSKLLAAVIGVVFADLLMWMQLGFLTAAIEGATYIHNLLLGELILVNPQSEVLMQAKPFPRAYLTRALSHPDVKGTATLRLGSVTWKNPDGLGASSGEKRNLSLYRIEPFAPAIGAPGVEENAAKLTFVDTVLFDRESRPEFAPVVAKYQSGERVEAEVNGRRVQVVGTTAIGASFQVDGNLITSDLNFQRFTNRPPGAVDAGIIKLRTGADSSQVKVELQKILGEDILVMTKSEYIMKDRDYLTHHSPVNFIFGLGTAVAFLVGFAIVYQVLFTDVSNHLPQFATLKAIGYSDGYLQQVVLQEALILSILGFLPGTLISSGLYTMARSATRLPMTMTLERGFLIFGLTVMMCSLSGMLAMRKLRQADPAEVF
ncbi:MAG: ABC transporter permease DevC [Gimesia chilikensis]|uniref:ABC transporter permease DevC n=1 Tax=Gimesia chilikensis TaxID=2605989 RepID=UPI0037B7CE2F